MKVGSLVTGAAVVAALAAGWLVRVAVGEGSRPAPAAPEVATATAPVTRGDVTEWVQVAGTLDYDATRQVVNQLPSGVLTAVAGPGRTLRRGARLFAVAGTPALLLYGTTPAYRDFSAGMRDGADVLALERNLVAMGMDPDRAITVDRHFTRATGAAIRRWRAARGLPASQRGTIRLGEVVFLPGPARVGEATAAVGASVAPGAPILSVTSTRRVVTAQLTADRRHLVDVGDTVRVTLPGGGDPVAGTVTRIGRVASAEPAASGPPTPPGQAGQPTVAATVGLRVPAAARDLDQAPAQVAIVAARHTDVLLVPVTALLAKAGAGYQVRVVDGGAARLVDVRPGLYDDAAGTVEVEGAPSGTGPEGPGLREGMAVEVPAT
jgi:hypothetical protein